MISQSINKWCYKKKTKEIRVFQNWFCHKIIIKHWNLYDLLGYKGELKNPFENRNKHIRIKGPTPNTKRTIFAVLGVVLFSWSASKSLEVNFFLDFCLGILK